MVGMWLVLGCCRYWQCHLANHASATHLLATRPPTRHLPERLPATGHLAAHTGHTGHTGHPPARLASWQVGQGVDRCVASGRVGEWASGRVGEWASGRVGGKHSGGEWVGGQLATNR